ncbi:phosphatase [Exiguobacterium sp. SH1S21]|nr:phosphatase [Exiguobacterium sp. SH1S21]
MENMTDEELKELEKIGRREYDREYRERNREKRLESVRRSRIKKGIRTLQQGVN